MAKRKNIEKGVSRKRRKLTHACCQRELNSQTFECEECATKWHKSCLTEQFGSTIDWRSREQSFVCPNCDPFDDDEVASPLVCCDKIGGAQFACACGKAYHHTCIIDLYKFTARNGVFHCPACWYGHETRLLDLEGEANGFIKMIVENPKKIRVWNDRIRDRIQEFTMYSGEAGNWIDAGRGLDALSRLVAMRIDKSKEFADKVWLSMLGGKQKRPKKANNKRKKDEDEEKQMEEDKKVKEKEVLTLAEQRLTKYNMAKQQKYRNEYYLHYSGVKRNFQALAVLKISSMAAYMPQHNSKRRKMSISQYYTQKSEPDEIPEVDEIFGQVFKRGRIIPPPKNACTQALKCMQNYIEDPKEERLDLGGLSKEMAEIEKSQKIRRRSSLGSQSQPKKVLKKIHIVIKSSDATGKKWEDAKTLIRDILGPELSFQKTLTGKLHIESKTTVRMKRKILKERIGNGLEILGISVLEIRKKRGKQTKKKDRLREQAYEEKYEKQAKNVAETKKQILAMLPKKKGEMIHWQQEIVPQLPSDLGWKLAANFLLYIINAHEGRFVTVPEPGNVKRFSIRREYD